MWTGRMPMQPKPIPKSFAWMLAAMVLVLVGCRQDMHDAPKIEPLEANAFFDDGQGSRQIPKGTVARGQLRADTHLYEGKDAAGQFLNVLPAGMEPTRELLERGQERFEIYCSVCHDSTGGGRGMIVRRGFKQPPPLYEQRLKDSPLGYFYDVMSNGFGVMSPYSKQVSVEDRWAIAAYLRALQLSQTSLVALLPEDTVREIPMHVLKDLPDHVTSSLPEDLRHEIANAPDEPVDMGEHGAGDHGSADHGSADHGGGH